MKMGNFGTDIKGNCGQKVRLKYSLIIHCQKETVDRNYMKKLS